MWGILAKTCKSFIQASKKMSPREAVLAPNWRSWGTIWRSWRQLGAILIPTSLILAPSWHQLQKFKAHLGYFFGILGDILDKSARTPENDDSTSLLLVFGYLGGCLPEPFAAILGHLAAMLGYVGPSCHHLAATW